MPQYFRLPGARLAKRRLLLLCLAALGAVLALLPFAGRFLWVDDPLQPSDAILVLSGTPAERVLEGYDLYHSGYAPVLVLTREAPDGGQITLARRDVPFEDRTDAARDLLIRLGVPREQVLIVPGQVDSTADEARATRRLISDRHWHRMIVVTSKMHTRRTRMTMTRTWKDLDVQVIVRSTHYDLADPVHWWRRRADMRFMLFELEKYVAYWLGVQG